MNAPVAGTTFGVPVETAVAACSPVALASLKAWMDLGARPKPVAAVMLVGARMMAVIDFQVPVVGGERLVDGVAVPLIVTLFDGSGGEERLARVKAGDAIRDLYLQACAHHAGQSPNPQPERQG